MSASARAKKLHERTHEAWAGKWDGFYQRTGDRLPDTVFDTLEAESAILKAQNGTPEEVEALLKAVDETVMSGLELNKPAWDEWVRQFEDTFRGIELDDIFKADFARTPQRLPKPPEQPHSAFDKVQSWDYPRTLEGLCRASTAYYLACALELWTANPGRQA